MTLVTTAAELHSALASAQPGDTIQLASGNYGDITIDGANFSDFVTLAAADTANAPVFTGVAIKNSSHLRLDGIKLEHILDPGEPDWVSGMRIDQSDHIEITSSEFTGSDDGNYMNDGQGFLALDSTHVALTGNALHDLKVGAGFGRAQHVEVGNNTFYDIRSDGLNLGAVSHADIHGNSFTDFHPATADHPDMIQVFNNGARQDMTDITIRSNTLMQGDGAPVQGIFIQGVPPGEQATYPFDATNFTIESNTIDLGSSQGIWVSDVDGLAITGNLITEVAGAPLTPTIRTMDTTGATVSGNTAPAIDDVGSTGIVYSGNTITAGGSPGHGTSGDDTIYGHADDNAINAGAGNDEVHGADGNDGLFGGDGNDLIFGEAGDDTLYGNGGNDTLNGGAGNNNLYGGSRADTFVFASDAFVTTVHDFDAAEFDTLDMSGTGFLTTADVPAAAQQVGTTTLITVNTDTTIELIDIELSNLAAGDLWFG